MFDIHYHLLHGLDDGPKTLNDSVALAEASIAEGVTHIVATPHANERYVFDPVLIQERAAELENALNGRIAVGLGCDMHLSFDNIEEATHNPKKFAINGGRYILVEFSDTSIPLHVDDIFFQLQVEGVVPIITHPERNPPVLSNPDRLERWVNQGCLVQVTAASITGEFGRRAESMALHWIGLNWVHIVASDAHGVKWRGPRMAAAREALRQQFDESTAERLCMDNPKAVFFNEDLSIQPEPLRSQYRPRSFRRSFFSRILRRD